MPPVVEVMKMFSNDLKTDDNRKKSPSSGQTSSSPSTAARTSETGAQSAAYNEIDEKMSAAKAVLKLVGLSSADADYDILASQLMRVSQFYPQNLHDFVQLLGRLVDAGASAKEITEIISEDERLKIVSPTPPKPTPVHLPDVPVVNSPAEDITYQEQQQQQFLKRKIYYGNSYKFNRAVKKRKPFMPMDYSPIIIEISDDENSIPTSKKIANEKLKILESQLASMNRMIASLEEKNKMNKRSSSESLTSASLDASTIVKYETELRFEERRDEMKDEIRVKNLNIERLQDQIQLNMQEMSKLRSALMDLEKSTQLLLREKLQTESDLSNLQSKLKTPNAADSVKPPQKPNSVVVGGRSHKAVKTVSGSKEEVVGRLLKTLEKNMSDYKKIIEVEERICLASLDERKEIFQSFIESINNFTVPTGSETDAIQLTLSLNGRSSRENDKSSVNTDIEYSSPLTCFKTFKYSLINHNTRPITSATWTNAVNPSSIVCRYEVQGGQCADTKCSSQHLRDILPSESMILKSTLQDLQAIFLPPWQLVKPDCLPEVIGCLKEVFLELPFEQLISAICDIRRTFVRSSRYSISASQFHLDDVATSPAVDAETVDDERFDSSSDMDLSSS